jgi:hypothetical protein
MDVIVIPTYNEAENISDILDWLLEFSPRLVWALAKGCSCCCSRRCSG